ncbi:MAG: hypothetical protein HEQ32_02250 [Vampirovibrio sp.]
MGGAINPVSNTSYRPSSLQIPQFVGPTLPLQGPPFPPVNAIGSGNIGPRNSSFSGFDPSQFAQLGVSSLTPQLGSPFQMKASQNACSAGGRLNVCG